MDKSWTEILEVMSYVVQIVGLPGAIYLFLMEQAKERLAEQQEIDGQLKEQYNHILDNLIEHPELDHHEAPLTGDQAKQQQRIYQELISCFETAFIRLYGRKNASLGRMWNSWQDGIDEWLREPNFSTSLPKLLVGEDEHFAEYMLQRSEEIKVAAASTRPAHDDAPEGPALP
ncbi:MAG: hypothetical protein KJ017_08220 [Alphaproteobacteria bacterium]|nr:hypothetical protein [Alphaproteobacteria bacterium]